MRPSRTFSRLRSNARALWPRSATRPQALDEDDDPQDHGRDLGAVAAAAADEGEGGAANDGSGMYEVYVPKLVRVSRVLHAVERARRG